MINSLKLSATLFLIIGILLLLISLMLRYFLDFKCVKLSYLSVCIIVITILFIVLL